MTGHAAGGGGPMADSRRMEQPAPAPGAGHGSWGRYPHSRPAGVLRLRWRHQPLPATGPMLPYGNGRSYGDACLNNDGLLLDTRGLDRFIAFDPATGVLVCEAGVLLSQILDLVVPHGWFLPVTPGTKLVTVGGAIANDVHGKNHHRVGTFGRHVRRFELLRSDGSRRVCSPEEHQDWFGATIGGLGLTGLITWAEVALQRIPGPCLDVETTRFRRLRDFFALSARADADNDYTVAWVDCLARGDALGRGIFMRANHVPTPARGGPAPPRRRPAIPVTPPVSLVNRSSVRLFNAAYYHRRSERGSRGLQHYEPFFYPLDAIGNWNRIYGPNGFLQYQCVVPTSGAEAALDEMLGRVAAARTGSFLSVLKVFGSHRSPGWLSFPRPGVTLALDFPNAGPAVRALLDELDRVVAAAGGAVYPAKDARMAADHFKRGFPEWRRLRDYVDPAFSSDLWRRVTGDTT